jgi:hypothetical protein
MRLKTCLLTFYRFVFVNNLNLCDCLYRLIDFLPRHEERDIYFCIIIMNRIQWTPYCIEQQEEEKKCLVISTVLCSLNTMNKNTAQYL